MKQIRFKAILCALTFALASCATQPYDAPTRQMKRDAAMAENGTYYYLAKGGKFYIIEVNGGKVTFCFRF